MRRPPSWCSISFNRSFSRSFDPFAPVWLFLVGYLQIYVIQAFNYHEWAVEVRGRELVAAANFRSFWALAWFLLVYQLGPTRKAARMLPRLRINWSPRLAGFICPPLIIWGLFCANMFISGDAPTLESYTSEEALVRSFPFVMLVAAVMLMITGRTTQAVRPMFLWAGFLTGAAYVMIWMFNGKRSHSLIGLLATVCAFYLTRQKRPSWTVLITTGVIGALVVTIAIGWRESSNYPRTVGGFVQYLSEFQPEKILVNLNVKDDEEGPEIVTYEIVRIRWVSVDDGHRAREVALRLRRELSSRLFHLHPADHLAQQALVRPKQMDRRVDGRFRDGARRRLRRPGDRPSGGNPT